MERNKMLRVNTYKKIEAIEDLLDFYVLLMAELHARSSLVSSRIKSIRKRIATIDSAQENFFGYTLLRLNIEQLNHIQLQIATCEHYIDGLKQRMNETLEDSNDNS